MHKIPYEYEDTEQSNILHQKKKNTVPNMLLHYENWSVTNPLFKEIYILLFFKWVKSLSGKMLSTLSLTADKKYTHIILK